VSEAVPVRVLIVEDDPDTARLLGTLLTGTGVPAPVHAASGRAGIAAATQADIVILDYELPDATGMEVLDAVRRLPGAPSVIVVTAHGSESLAAAALRSGAEDYLVKDPSLPELLPRAFERVRRTRELRTALATAERELVRTERLAAIGEITVTLHHELNNPLMAAGAEVDLLLADRSVLGAHREALLAVRTSLDRIRDILWRSRQLPEARAVPYLEGISMIALESVADAGETTDRGVAALYAPDDDLARVTALLLRRAGFQVDRHREAAALDAASRESTVRLVIVAADTGEAPLAGFRPASERGYRVAALVSDSGTRARAAGADHVVQLPFDPATLSDELTALLD
jgi:DNA-binding response OmpR family regulator